MLTEETRRYSEAFKLHIVNEIEKGGIGSLNQLRQKYGIGGGSTLTNWLRRYGKEHLLTRKVRIEMPDETTEVKKLKKRIKLLEKALANAKTDSVIDQACFELLCEEKGIIDIAGHKKKIAKRLLEEDE